MLANILPALTAVSRSFLGHITTKSSAEIYSKSLRTVLREWRAMAEAVIELASSSSSNLVGEVGEQIVFILTMLEDTYKDNLDLTINKLADAFKAKIVQFDSILRQFEQRNHLEQLPQQLQQFINSSIFATNYPQFTAMFPHCVVAGQVNTFMLNFSGNFLEAAKPGFHPILTLKGCQTELTQNQTQRLAFTVTPESDLPPNQLITGQLIVPYSHYLTKKILQYKIGVMSVPKNPGSITIESTSTIISSEQRKKTSQLFKISSRNESGGQDRDQICNLKATPGWKLLRGTRQPNIHKMEGKQELTCVEESDSLVSYRARTFRHKKKDNKSGVIHFTFSSIEYREVEANGPLKITPVELNWGSSKVFNFPPRTWKVIFHPFDNTSAQREFLDSSFEDPYIDVIVENNSLRIKAKDLSKIKVSKVIHLIGTTIPPKQEVEEVQKNAVVPCTIASLGGAFGLGVLSGLFLRSRL